MAIIAALALHVTIGAIWYHLAASAAARATSLSAASAYTHPFTDGNQAKHILGPAACAALAIEIKADNDPQFGDAKVKWAVEHVRLEVCELLMKMPNQPSGRNRLERIMADLDSLLRKRYRDFP